MKYILSLLLVVLFASCATQKSIDRKFNRAEKQTIKDLRKMGLLN